MERKFETSEEMEKALALHAEITGKSADSLWTAVVTSSMNSLIESLRSHMKDQYITKYQNLSSVDKASVDSLLAKG